MIHDSKNRFSVASFADIQYKHELCLSLEWLLSDPLKWGGCTSALDMVRVRKQHGERSWCSTDYSFQKGCNISMQKPSQHFRHLWQACDACDLRCGSLGIGDLLVSKTLAWRNLSSNTGSAGVMSLWCPSHSTYSRTQFSRLQIELRGPGGWWWISFHFLVIRKPVHILSIKNLGREWLSFGVSWGAFFIEIIENTK